MKREKSKIETKEKYEKIKTYNSKKNNNNTNRNNPNSISSNNNSTTNISRCSH